LTKSLLFSLSISIALCVLLTRFPSVHGDGPADNRTDQVRPVPPPGIELSAETQLQLREGAQKLRSRLAELSHPHPTPQELIQRGLCEVIPRAVLMTLETNMFYSDKEVQGAIELLELGHQRLALLNAGASPLQLLLGSQEELPTLVEPQAVAGGFRSHIDDSVQPYGLILPRGWKADSAQPLRLDVWLHGRGEKVSEAAFLQQRMRQLGEYTPDNTVVLHPYGRYCNAFKFAGEIDVLEAIEHVKQLLPIDEQRIVIRGFSMGGAGCWQLAVHYPNLWAAANPGAGFSETTEFLRVFQQEEIQPTDFQQRLLHWYDCPDWTNNLRQVPTIAYSGEKDRQKQAADVMEAAFAARGMSLPHIIGPNTEHKIHADSKLEIEKLLSSALVEGKPAIPKTIDLTTFSLRYHQLGWLSIEGLQEHWRESRVQGQWLESEALIGLTTHGVTRLALQFPELPSTPVRPIREVQIDGQNLSVAEHWPNPHAQLHLIREASSGWRLVTSTETLDTMAVRKRPGLQGPIDDAFMDRFTFVGPGGSVKSTTVDAWAKSEFQRAAHEWKRHFRGDPPISDMPAGAAVDMGQNLVLFGRPSTNPLIAQVLSGLPIEWDEHWLKVNGQSYPAATHIPILIYPLPQRLSTGSSMEHYVVLNSGFTFREYAYLNNARQVPMLPDWAVVDTSQAATPQAPGKIVAAGFFDERWKFAEQ
jgi:hypothetical protein